MVDKEVSTGQAHTHKKNLQMPKRMKQFMDQDHKGNFICLLFATSNIAHEKAFDEDCISWLMVVEVHGMPS